MHTKKEIDIGMADLRSQLEAVWIDELGKWEKCRSRDELEYTFAMSILELIGKIVPTM